MSLMDRHNKSNIAMSFFMILLVILVFIGISIGRKDQADTIPAGAESAADPALKQTSEMSDAELLNDLEGTLNSIKL